MSVRKGRDWGAHGPLAQGSPVVDNDAAIVEAAEKGATEVALLGGDLHRTVGSPSHTPDQLLAGEGMRLPVDLGEATLTQADGSTQTVRFAAHMVAVEDGRAVFAAPTLVVMNAAFLGPTNLGPRAHPGDGLLDLTEGRLVLWDRLRARRRARTGTHVPHPDLHVRRVRRAEVRFHRPAVVTVDDRPAGTAVTVSVRCLPDAITVVV